MQDNSMDPIAIFILSKAVQAVLAPKLPIKSNIIWFQLKKELTPLKNSPLNLSGEIFLLQIVKHNWLIWKLQVGTYI